MISFHLSKDGKSLTVGTIEDIKLTVGPGKNNSIVLADIEGDDRILEITIVVEQLKVSFNSNYK